MNVVSVFNAVIVLTYLTFSSGFPVCGGGFYYDGLAGKCDHCAKLCYPTTTPNSRHDCHTKCPGFLPTTTKRKRTDGLKKRSDCPKGSYFDPHVGYRGKCELCEQLCHAHTIRGNTEDCKSKCPGFLPTTTKRKQTDGLTKRSDCPKGSYFDPHVGYRGKCELCEQLCHAHTIRGNTEDCKSKCPDEYASQLAKAEDPRKDRNKRVKELDAQGSALQSGEENNDNNTDNHVLIIIVLVGALASLMILIFSLYKMKIHRCSMHDERNDEDIVQIENLLERKRLPVQETSMNTCETDLDQPESDQSEVIQQAVCHEDISQSVSQSDISQTNVHPSETISQTDSSYHEVPVLPEEQMAFGELLSTDRYSYRFQEPFPNV